MNREQVSVLASMLLLFHATVDASWTQFTAVSGKADDAKKRLTASSNGRIQTPEQASKPFDCSSIPISNKLFNLSGLNQDWKIASDGDAMMLNPCGSLRYSNNVCPAGQTNLCLLEKTGNNGVVSFGTISKVLLSPKGSAQCSTFFGCR